MLLIRKLQESPDPINSFELIIKQIRKFIE